MIVKDNEWSKENIPGSGTNTGPSSTADADTESVGKSASTSTESKKVETRPITPALDPYAEFLQNQKKREANWKAERAAKRTRLRKSEETERETPQICLDERVKRNIEASSDEVRQLKQQSSPRGFLQDG